MAKYKEKAEQTSFNLLEIELKSKMLFYQNISHKSNKHFKGHSTKIWRGALVKILELGTL